MKSIELKVKAKSLADEARTIRIEERKAAKRRDTAALSRLQMHRVLVVRREARATHLARAFLAGRLYETVEAHTREPWPTWLLDKVFRMVRQYGWPEAERGAIEAWLNEKKKGPA